MKRHFRPVENSFVYNNLKYILTDISHSYNEIVLEAIQTGVWHDPLVEFCVILNYNPITDIDKCSITHNKGNIPYYLVDVQTKIFDICKFYQIFKRCSVIVPCVLQLLLQMFLSWDLKQMWTF